MFKLELRQNELDVLNYRRAGLTFRECAEKMGHNHFQQTQALFYTTVRKLRIWNDLNLHNRELLRAAKKLGKSQRWILNLYTFMRNNGIAYHWKGMTDDELMAIPNFGTGYLEFLHVARTLN